MSKIAILAKIFNFAEEIFEVLLFVLAVYIFTRILAHTPEIVNAVRNIVRRVQSREEWCRLEQEFSGR